MEVAKENKVFQAIGKNIKKHRNNSTKSQADFARLVGLSRTSLVNIEQGRQQPSLFMLWRIAEALDLELKDLLPSRAEVANSDKIEIVAHDDLFTNKEETKHLLSEFLKSTK